MLNLKVNDLFALNYRLVKRLGSGGFSEVWLARNEEAGIQQVLKIYTGVGREGVEIFRSEFARVYNLNHPRILKTTRFSVYNELPYLVMPYYHKGSVLKLINTFTERELAIVIKDVGGALAYIHSPDYEMVHKDIKPDNIIIDNDNHYLLSDFGISTQLRKELRSFADEKKELASSGAGITPMAYRAPEYFDALNSGLDPIIASDIWAFGATLYEMATGIQPFGHMGGSVQHGNQPIPPDLPSKFSEGFNEVIKSCMAKEPWDRPSAKELKRMATHFLNTGRWVARGNDYSSSKGQGVSDSSSVKINPAFVPGKTIEQKEPRRKKKEFNPTLIPLYVLIGLLVVGSIGYALNNWLDPTGSNGGGGVVETDSLQNNGGGEILSPGIDSALAESDNTNGANGTADSNANGEELTQIMDNSADNLVPSPSPGFNTNDEAQEAPYTFIKPYVRKQPNDNSQQTCKLTMERVCLKKEATEVTISLKDCGKVDIFGPRSEHSFYIKCGDANYSLVKVEGARTGEGIVIEGNRTVNFHFEPLPKTTKTFDLLEGRRETEGRVFWHFKGVELKHR